MPGTADRESRTAAHAPGSELAAAVAAVAAGGRYLQPDLAVRLAGHTPPGPDTLTDREQTALLLWADGHTNTDVARVLSVSVRSVENLRADLRYASA